MVLKHGLHVPKIINVDLLMVCMIKWVSGFCFTPSEQYFQPYHSENKLWYLVFLLRVMCPGGATYSLTVVSVS
jgi:hypothetical protein